MVGNIENLKFGFTIVSSCCGVLCIYHKFIIGQIEKKVDQKLYDKEIGHTQTQVKNNYTNLKDKIDGLSEDIKIIKECIINKK